MNSPDDRLRDLVRGATENQPLPDFESSWRRAQARSKERRGAGSPSRWRWALGPADGAGEEDGLIAFADAGVLDSAPLADLETPVVPASPLSGLDDSTGDSVATAEAEKGEVRPGYGLYEAGTDFLLTMEIPAWDQAGERSVL